MTKPSDTPTDKISLQGVHLDLTPALQASIREKLAVLLRHNEHIVRINVRLAHEQTLGRNHLYSATGRIEISGPDLVASVKGDDAYSVIDGLAHKLDQQLRERHERRKERRNHPHPVELDTQLPKTGQP